MPGKLREFFNNKMKELDERRKATDRLALDVAAQELGIGTDSVRFSDKNPAIQQKAREVRNDPQFKEIMERILEGKTKDRSGGSRIIRILLTG